MTHGNYNFHKCDYCTADATGNIGRFRHCDAHRALAQRDALTARDVDDKQARRQKLETDNKRKRGER